MNKKILIVFLVVILVAGIFFLTRNNQKSTKAHKVSKEAFVKLTNVSKKIPNAGLTQMGNALIRYQEKNGKYPIQLSELYPDFIPLKEFIEEVDWYYELRDNDFFLSKTIIKNNKQMIASIDKKLVPRMGTGAVVASASSVEKPPSVVVKEDTTTSSSLMITLKPLDLIIEEEEQIESIIEQIEIVSVVEGDIGLGVSSGISKKTLVWKDENGVLGFGNVKYPETSEMAIYRDHSWVGLKRPPPRVPEKTNTKEKVTEKSTEKIALGLGNKFLVWKSKNGTIGLGNVQAPRLDNISALCIDGKWVSIEKKLPEPQEPVPTFYEPSEKDESTEDIGKKYSNKFLVWKDKEGNIGFGNVQGPKLDNVTTICVDGKWIEIEKDLPKIHEPMEPIEKPVERKTSAEEIVNQLSKRYLVWKDKDGRIGYGNVQSPRTDDVVSVFINGQWLNIEKELPIKQNIQAPMPKITKKDADQIASDYSGKYLIWKDKKGKIGYGNVQYPEIDNIAYICINGTWQEVVN